MLIKGREGTSSAKLLLVEQLLSDCTIFKDVGKQCPVPPLPIPQSPPVKKEVLVQQGLCTSRHFQLGRFWLAMPGPQYFEYTPPVCMEQDPLEKHRMLSVLRNIYSQ